MGEGRRRLRGRDFLFLVVVAAVITFLVFLSRTGKERFIGRTQAHLAVVGIEDNAKADAVCRSCHEVDAVVGHPLRKKNCRQCHRLERKNP
jgi:hypothetical protein